MSVLNHYINMWRNAFDFSGKTDRPGFWWAVLVGFVISLVVGVINIQLLSNLYSLVVLVPELSLSIRRLRDAGKGWGWLFINLIPGIGQIVFIVLLCMPSKKEDVIDV